MMIGILGCIWKGDAGRGKRWDQDSSRVGRRAVSFCMCSNHAQSAFERKRNSGKSSDIDRQCPVVTPSGGTPAVGLRPCSPWRASSW